MKEGSTRRADIGNLVERMKGNLCISNFKQLFLFIKHEYANIPEITYNVF